MRVVYSDQVNAVVQGYSPSPAKPALVINAWQLRWPDLVVRPPTPVNRSDLIRAHDPSFVDGVLSLNTANGFGTKSRAVIESVMYTNGAFLTAATWAVMAKSAVAAPVSGFHHASWDEAADFCTFNGLLVSAFALQAKHPGMRIGILDYDYHYGNGTVDILEHLGCEDIIHITAGDQWHTQDQADAFLANIDEDLKRLSACDVVLYQAGADPHLDDPLGGFLTTEQLAYRDECVFAGLRKLNVPVAWVLAGGYQRPIDKVVEIHVNTMAAAVHAYAQ